MLIRNPINPYPQNITIDPNKAFISFTFVGDRLGSYKIRIYTYSTTEAEQMVFESNTVNISNYAYNNEEIIFSGKTLSNMGVASGKAYTWEVVMSPEKNLANTKTTSLRYYFETSLTPRIVASPENLNLNIESAFLVNSQEKKYDYSLNIPHIDIADLQSRIIKIEGYYSHANIKYYYFNLYDEDGNLIDTTDKVFSSKIEYTFSGLLSFKSYTLDFFAVSQKDQIIYIVFDITTTYEGNINADYFPTATCNQDEANVVVEWAKDMTAGGAATGSYEFTSNNNEVKINSGQIVYDEISSFPIPMDKLNFAIGIKTTINDNTTQIFDYVNNDILYEVYMENYIIYLRYGHIKYTNKTILKVCNFKNDIVFGIQADATAASDTGYVFYTGTNESGETYTINKSTSSYILVSEQTSYKYWILLQSHNGAVTCTGERM